MSTLGGTLHPLPPERFVCPKRVHGANIFGRIYSRKSHWASPNRKGEAANNKFFLSEEPRFIEPVGASMLHRSTTHAHKTQTILVPNMARGLSIPLSCSLQGKRHVIEIIENSKVEK